MAYTGPWNLTFERMLGSNSAISLSYVGNRGIGFLQYNGTKRAQFPAVSTVPANYVGNNFTGVLFDQIDRISSTRTHLRIHFSGATPH